MFSYSDEDSSASFHLDAKVDGRTIHNRKQKLMALQRRISKARNRKMIGREVDVLIEGLSPDTDLLWQARMSTQAPEIDGFCYVNDFAGAPPRRGEIRRMRITEAHDYDLIGALDVASEEPCLAARQCFSDPCQRAMKCPICKKEVSPDDPFFPFCSERCKIIDLGNWASEKYVISTPVQPEDLENEGEGQE